MGRYRVQGPDGRIHVIEAPEGASQAQILAFAESKIGLAPPPAVSAAKPEADLNDTNFLKDTAASFVSGIGQLLELPAQLYGLATGDFETAVGDVAQSVTKYGEEMKSPGLRARQEGAQERIAAADKEGFFSGLTTGIGEYLSDPRLLAAGVTEVIPSLFGTAGAGALASTGAKRLVAKEAAELAAQRAAVAGGAGFGAVQQGADVGTDAYVKAMQIPDAIWARDEEFSGRVAAGENPEAVKQDMALDIARGTALAGGAVSAFTAGVLPGTFEKVVLGKAMADKGLLSRAGRGFAGEAAQEATEEGGGALAQNIGLQTINPEQSLTEGVGSQVGIAGLLGGLTGAGASAGFGGAPQAAEAPPVPGEPEPQIFKAPVTAPPSEGLIGVLGTPGSDIIVDDDGVPTPYKFGGLSDEGHVILVGGNGDQIYADPASLEGVVSAPQPEAPPVAGEPPIETPPVGTPPGVPPTEMPPVSPPEVVPPSAGTPPVESPPVETPPTGTPPSPPVGGTPPIDVTEPAVGAPPIDVTEPVAGTPPVAEPAPVAPPVPPVAEPGDVIPPQAADDVFTEDEGKLAGIPNPELAANLRGKKPMQAINYLAKNARTPYLRKVASQAAGMMRTLEKMGYNFTFKVVSPTTSVKEPGLKKSIQDFKANKGSLGAVYSYPNPFRPGFHRGDILLRDINYPGGNSGANERTAVHEFIHAASAALIFEYEKGNIDKNSRVGKAVAELRQLHLESKKFFNGVLDGTIPVSQKTLDIAKDLKPWNAFQNEHELLTYGMTDWRMQHLLKQMKVKGVNGFTAFVRAIGKMLGFNKSDTNGLRRLIELSEQIMPGDTKRRIENAQIAMGKQTAVTPSEMSEEPQALVTTEEPAAPEEAGVAPTAIGQDQSVEQASADWSDKRIKDYLREYGYSMDSSKTKGLAVSMTPDQFLDLTTNDRQHKADIVKEAGELDLDRLRGEPSSIFLSVEETPNGLQVIGHEGRHRMAALKASGITDAPVVLRFYKGEQRQPQDLVKLYPEDFGEGRNGRKMQFGFNAIPISYDYADQLAGMMGEYGRVKVTYQANDGAQAISDIAASDRTAGDEVIAKTAEPIKQINEDRLDLQMEGQAPAKFSSKAIAKSGQVMPPVSPSVDAVGNIGMIGSFLTPASALARTNKWFRAMFDNMNDKLAYRNLLMSRPEKMFAELTRMSQESKDNLNRVLEYLRLSATELKEKPEQFSIETKKLFRDDKYVEPALSKPGETLKLNKEETAMLYRIRDYLDETYTLNAQSILQAVGYDGVYSREAIEALPVETEQEIRKRDSFLRLFNAIESQRVTSYIPFMRDGDMRVIVKRKFTDENGKEKVDLAAFYMIDSNQWLREIVGPDNVIGRNIPDNGYKARLAEIQKKFPAKDGYVIQTTSLAGRMNDKLQISDLGTLDKLVALMDANSGKAIKDYFDKTMGGLIDSGELDAYSQAYAEQLAKGYIADWPEQIREILMKQIAAGFMKQSNNIPGYDTNLVDKLFDYNRIVATTISHRRYRPEYSRAFDEMKANHAPGSATLKYAEAWDRNADTTEHAIWRGARAVGFFNAMWGSFSSSMVNAMSIWTLVAPQMMVMDGAATRDIYKNSVKLIGAIGLDKDVGAYINVDKIRGITPDQREALNWAYRTGVVRAQINPDLMGMEASMLTTKGGKLGAAMKRYFDIGGSVVSVTEEMNKVAAFLTAYKYAQNPKALQNWKEAFANNERAKAIMAKGSSPQDVAAFMTETTTFIGGQLENAPILRGAGGVVFQFSQYPLQVAHLMYQNFAKMGPRGKQAGLFTLLTMFSVSGLLFAIPFGDDAINIFEWLTEKITGKKRDFRLETQQMLADMFGDGPDAQRNAEALLYGPFRSLLGLNIGERIGFTSMLPELNNPVTAIPALSGTLGKFEEYKNRKPDQPLAAYTALLSPLMGKGVTDVVRGMIVFPEEGYRTQFGSNIKSPEDITMGEQFARAAGFQSADIARLVRAKRAGEEINTSTQGAERNNTRRLGKLLADAIRAERVGNQAEADRLRSEFQTELAGISDKFSEDIQNGKLADGVKPPSSQALREAVMFDLYPETRINTYGKLKRRAILDARRDVLLSGEEDFPEMVEDQEEFDSQFETQE